MHPRVTNLSTRYRSGSSRVEELTFDHTKPLRAQITLAQRRASRSFPFDRLFQR
jgi:hypothetical protein